MTARATMPLTAWLARRNGPGWHGPGTHSLARLAAGKKPKRKPAKPGCPAVDSGRVWASAEGVRWLRGASCCLGSTSSAQEWCVRCAQPGQTKAPVETHARERALQAILLSVMYYFIYLAAIEQKEIST